MILRRTLSRTLSLRASILPFVLIVAACGDEITVLHNGDASCQIDDAAVDGPMADASAMDGPSPAVDAPLVDAPDQLDMGSVNSAVDAQSDVIAFVADSGADTACQAPLPRPRPQKACIPSDFNGDGKTDFGVWDLSTGQWLLEGPPSLVQLRSQMFATKGDIAVPGDFNGDGLADFSVFSPDGTWTQAAEAFDFPVWFSDWGTMGDVPLAHDFDHDGICDLSIWRPSTGSWQILPSSRPRGRIIMSWGDKDDQPVPADYDGDGQSDVAYFRAETGRWRVTLMQSKETLGQHVGGQAGDIAVGGDFDGDGRGDFTVFRPSEAKWMMMLSSKPCAEAESVKWGEPNSIPLEGDYDGDGKADLATWFARTGVFKVRSSKDGSTITSTMGNIHDMPLAAPAYVKAKNAALAP